MTPMPQCLDPTIMRARQDLLAKDYTTPLADMPPNTHLCRTNSVEPIIIPHHSPHKLHAYGFQKHHTGHLPYHVWQDTADKTAYTLEAIDNSGGHATRIHMQHYSPNRLDALIRETCYPIHSLWDYHTMHLDDWAWWHTLDRTRCFYCHRRTQHLETDHMDPRALAGSPRRCNKAPACRPCNEEKSATPLHDWLATIDSRWQR